MIVKHEGTDGYLKSHDPLKIFKVHETLSWLYRNSMIFGIFDLEALNFALFPNI